MRPAETNRRVDAFVPGLMNGVERLREGLRARFQAYALPDAPYADLVALAVGDPARVPPALWKVFATTGTLLRQAAALCIWKREAA